MFFHHRDGYRKEQRDNGKEAEPLVPNAGAKRHKIDVHPRPKGHLPQVIGMAGILPDRDVAAFAFPFVLAEKAVDSAIRQMSQEYGAHHDHDADDGKRRKTALLHRKQPGRKPCVHHDGWDVLQANEADQLKHERAILLAIFSVTPVLVTDALIGHQPVCRQAERPQAGQRKKNDGIDVPQTVLDHRRKQHHRRRYAPIRVVDGNVCINDGHNKDDQRCHRRKHSHGGKDIADKRKRHGAHAKRAKIRDHVDDQSLFVLDALSPLLFHQTHLSPIFVCFIVSYPHQKVERSTRLFVKRKKGRPKSTRFCKTYVIRSPGFPPPK